MYKVIISCNAQKGLAKLKKFEPKSFKKATSLLIELAEHPTTGTGKPELLKRFEGEVYSRRITKKHRLVYEIRESEIVVEVIASYGHYGDK